MAPGLFSVKQRNLYASGPIQRAFEHISLTEGHFRGRFNSLLHYSFNVIYWYWMILYLQNNFFWD